MARTKPTNSGQTKRLTSQIAPRARPHTPEDVIGDRVRGDGTFGGGFDHVYLVIEFLVKVGCHGRWVDSTHVNPQWLTFNVQTCGQLRHKSFG